MTDWYGPWLATDQHPSEHTETLTDEQVEAIADHVGDEVVDASRLESEYGSR